MGKLRVNGDWLRFRTVPVPFFTKLVSLVSLVHLVYLVYSVYPVSLVQGTE